MNLYFAGATALVKDKEFNNDITVNYCLESYFYFKKKMGNTDFDKLEIKKFFLDSGAFSAFTKDIKIDIHEYCNFIKEHKKKITYYSVLDVIGNAEGTLKNQKIMEKEELNPIPCFHYGDNFKYLEYYIENYDYISLGGMVPVSSRNLIPWLDDVFGNHICNKEGYPRCKVHGFGMTTVDIMVRYPWYSVDSTTYNSASRFGEINICKFRNNENIWNENPIRISVSEKSENKIKNGKSFHTESENYKKVVKKFVEYMNYNMDELIESTYKRQCFNIDFFKRLEKEITRMDIKFKNKKGLFN